MTLTKDWIIDVLCMKIGLKKSEASKICFADEQVYTHDGEYAREFSYHPILEQSEEENKFRLIARNNELVF